MMTFLFIEQVFPGIDINLRVLSRGTERYRMMLYQHQGILGLSDHGNKLGNLTEVDHQFDSFFKLARQKHADLVITPEYSCPWENIKKIIDHPEQWPAEGKLWALGTESITPVKLREFKEQYNSEDTYVHYDERPLEENGIFLDPLVYLFRATFANHERLIILIQFKTHHMGVWTGGDLERDRLIEGREIYIVRNNANSVNLLSMICSEAMNFPAQMDANNRARIGLNDLPFLILNPQVNPDPLHDAFISFRKFVFEQERKEIITLNWNYHSKIGARDLLRDATSRSGIYMVSHDVKFDDQARIRKNHKLGLYFFYFGKYKYAFVLNSKPHVYLIENLSVNITDGIMAQRMRNGPEIMETYTFDNDLKLASIVNVSDDLIACLTGYGCQNAFLTNPENCVLEKERLVCLSSGEFIPSTFESWAGLDKLFSVRMLEATEINKRLTVAEDMAIDSQQQRQRYIDAVNILDVTILPDKNMYPESIADLKAYPVFLGYAQETDVNRTKFIQREKFRYNLINQHGNMVKATVCHIGLADLKKATNAFEFLQSMFETDSMNRRRVVVFYRNGTTLAVKADEQAGRIVIPEEAKTSSFLS